MQEGQQTAAVSTYPEYPDYRLSPYHPSEQYPEHQSGHSDTPDNHIYASVRRLFVQLGMDNKNFGAPQWNPLGGLIVPGNRVFIKPNWVMHRNKGGSGMDCLITHPSIIRAVFDYVCIALEGHGKILIGDAPLQSCDFDSLQALPGTKELMDYFHSRGPDVEILDLRQELAVKKAGIVSSRTSLCGDPRGYAAVDFGRDSMLDPVRGHFRKFRVTNYNPGPMLRHHNETTHEYCISKSVLSSDVVINLAKMKTHRKAGITCALKNMVGINGNKDWLPHHRVGSRSEGYDEYMAASQRRALAAAVTDRIESLPACPARTALAQFRRALLFSNRLLPFGDNYHEGSWWGNDTIPRTIADLNRAALYAGPDGNLHETRCRKIFHVVDGVVAGEGEGPLEPEPFKAGILVGGYSAPAVDYICAMIMGFDPGKIPTIKYSLSDMKYRIADYRAKDILLRFENEEFSPATELPERITFSFRPTSGWAGHIEAD